MFAVTSQAESAEIKSPKWKVIRVEPGETQDYACEMLTISPDEAEELAFVPSALREPRGIYLCDNHCSETAVRCWQFASVVVEEGGGARTVNLCQQCFHEWRVQQGEPRLNWWQWRAVVEKKAHRGIILRIMVNDPFTRGMWEYFTVKRAEANRIQYDAAREKQEGIQGQWQQESPFREILEQARRDENMGMQLRSRAERQYRNKGQQMGRFQRRMQSERKVI